MQKIIKIGKKKISQDSPTYIIAEIGSNFDGSLKKAKKMVDLAVACGADCAKFQSFLPDKIVSKNGFNQKSESFQSNWKKSVYEVYSDAVFPREWHKELQDYCKQKKIDFASAPYDREAVDLLIKLDTPFIKIGSGEVTNPDFVAYAASTNKPLLIGVGAATMGDIEEMMFSIENAGNKEVVLMQCVTNYPSPFEDSNLRVLNTLATAFDVLVGYSDHTPGFTVPLGAVALGAKVIEKHFTDDKENVGPDHSFALNPNEFENMVTEIKNLEAALGSSIKRIVPSESVTKVLQRRGLYTTKQIKKGDIIANDDIVALRPAKGLAPKFKNIVVGKVAQQDLGGDEPVSWSLITQNKK